MARLAHPYHLKSLSPGTYTYLHSRKFLLVSHSHSIPFPLHTIALQRVDLSAHIAPPYEAFSMLAPDINSPVSVNTVHPTL